MANEVSIKLPAELVERVRTLAKEQNCTVAVLVQESLHRYEAFGRLISAITSDGENADALGGREDALDELLEITWIG